MQVVDFLRLCMASRPHGGLGLRNSGSVKGNCSKKMGYHVLWGVSVRGGDIFQELIKILHEEGA